MRIKILVLNPDVRLAGIADLGANNVVDFGAYEPYQLGPKPRHHPGIGVVQSHHDDPAWFGFPYDMGEGLPGVKSMMEDAVGNDHVEGVVLHRQVEDVHLGEAAAHQTVSQFVLDGKLQATQRHVDAEYMIVVELQIVG